MTGVYIPGSFYEHYNRRRRRIAVREHELHISERTGEAKKNEK